MKEQLDITDTINSIFPSNERNIELIQLGSLEEKINVIKLNFADLKFNEAKLCNDQAITPSKHRMVYFSGCTFFLRKCLMHSIYGYRVVDIEEIKSTTSEREAN